MCIRDSRESAPTAVADEQPSDIRAQRLCESRRVATAHRRRCLLYTSDAADERSSVDLGGRRIIKKKKTIDNHGSVTQI